ncbi:MAG: hypothetical protein ACOCXG_02590 [Nanoarchaeota archaeon]
MKFKIFLIFLLIAFTPSVFALTNIDTCQNLNVAGETYVVTQDITATGNCFSILADNIILDLNGHTLTGPGSNRGVLFGGSRVGVTIKNGVINNFDSGIYSYDYSPGFTLDNVDIVNSASYDVYISKTTMPSGGSMIITGDSTFTGQIYILYLNSLTIDQSNLEMSSLYLHYIDTIDFSAVTNLNSAGGIHMQGPTSATVNYPAALQMKTGRVCDSLFSGYVYSSDPYLLLTQDDSDSSVCTYIYQDGLTIDLGGHTISGAGTNFAFSLSNSPKDVVIKNGTINNFNYGVWSESAPKVTIDGISFTNNIDSDIYIAPSALGTDSGVTITGDTSLSGNLFVRYLHNFVLNQAELRANRAYIYYIETTDFTNSNFINLTTYITLQGPNKNVLFNPEFKLYLGDLCSSQISGVLYSNPLEIVLKNDQTSNGCFTLYPSNTILNLGGNTLSGTGGTTSSGISVSSLSGVNSVVVKNGTITNFGYAFRYEQTGNYSGDFSFENVNFVGNNLRDLRFSGGNKDYDKSVTITNCDFDGRSEFDYIKTVAINQTYIDFGSLDLSQVGNFDLSKTFEIDITGEFDLLNTYVTNQASTEILVQDLANSYIRYNTFENPLKILLRDDYSVAYDGFILYQSDLILDLNQKTLSGDGGSGDYGVQVYNAEVLGSTIKNGYINGFDRGIQYSSSSGSTPININISTIVFSGNTNYDIYFYSSSMSYDRDLNMYNVYPQKHLYVSYLDDVSFSGGGFSVDKITFNRINHLLLNSGSGFNVGEFDMTTYGNVVVLPDTVIGLGNTPLSLIQNNVLSNPLTLRLTQDQTCSNDCFNFYQSNLILDLGGYTMNGGGSYNGVEIQNSVPIENISIRNGVINDFSNGVYYYSTSANKLDVEISNITFLSSSVRDIYLYSSLNAYNKSAVIRNNNITDDIYLFRLKSVLMYGNSIPDGTKVSQTDVVNFDPDVMLSGGEVGNRWGDHICSNSTQNHTVVDEGIIYTICDSNGYNNVITDSVPILGMAAEPPSGGGDSTGSSSSTPSSEYPFGGFVSALLTLGMLLGYFAWSEKRE